MEKLVEAKKRIVLKINQTDDYVQMINKNIYDDLKQDVTRELILDCSRLQREESYRLGLYEALEIIDNMIDDYKRLGEE